MAINKEQELAGLADRGRYPGPLLLALTKCNPRMGR